MNKRENDTINFILDNYKGIRRNRALRIAAGELKTTDEEFKNFLFNELVRAKMSIITQYKNIEELTEWEHILVNRYKYFEGNGDMVQAAKTHLKIAEIKNLISKLEKLIASYGGFVANMLRGNLLTEHEACQLFNINWEEFKDRKQHYLEVCGEKKEHIVYLVIAITGCEYRWRKGREKSYFDCPQYEMPMFWAIHEYIMQEMKDNKDFHESTNKMFKELFPKVKTYKQSTDLEGNVLGYEEDK